MIEKLYDATVYASIANTDYEGEISDVGDKVVIRTRPTVTIRPYVKGMTLTYEKLEAPSIELLIDKGNYFGYSIDDVDAYQTDLELMNIWAEDATEQMRNTVDTEILVYQHSDVAAANQGLTAGRKSSSYNMGVSGTPLQMTKAEIVERIVDCGSVLGEQNVPRAGRWMVIPEWFSGMIKKSDLKDASLTGDGKSILRSGRIGVIDDFELYMSNNVDHVTDGAVEAYYVMFGDMGALTFASQITKVQHIPLVESTFAELMRGLNVYGRKVINNARHGLLYCYK